MPGGTIYLQVQHLVEIAIVDITIPTDRQGITTHQTIDSGRIESLHQTLHIGFIIATFQEVFEETADRHIRDSK